MKTRILLVDDEPNVLSSFRRQLRNAYEIVTEEDPTTALLALNLIRTRLTVFTCSPRKLEFVSRLSCSQHS